MTCIDIHIRQAKREDAPVIAEFNVLLAQETEGLHLDQGCISAGVEAILGDRTKGIYYVAEVNGTIAGQVMITYEWSDWRNGNLWWIQSVYVRSEFRRKGIFRALFKFLEDQARRQPDVRGLRLYMHAENTRARRSYETLGMQRTRYDVFELELEPGLWAGGG